MSIQPPSDIVLDVAQAADPLKSMAATQKLMRAAASDPSEQGFGDVMENVSAPMADAANAQSRLGFMSVGSGSAHPGPVDAKTKAYKGLEALVFQNLFETTLPHDESLGTGMAGDVWRSMLAEQLGKQTANVIDLGLFPKTSGSQGSTTSHGSPKGTKQTPLPISEPDVVESSS